MPGEGRDGRNVHLISNQLLNNRDVYTQSPDTAKVTIEKSDSECCANTLYICEHNQSIPNDYARTSCTTLRCDAYK